MSSKLVRKGLELVCGEQTAKKLKTPSASRRTRKTQAVRVSHVASGTGPGSARIINKEKRRRNLRDITTKQKKGKTERGLKSQQEVDYTEQNLKYFKHADWKVNKDIYEKVMQHQTERKWRKKTENEETGTTEPEAEDFDFE